jgi:hypothetical protein
LPALSGNPLARRESDPYLMCDISILSSGVLMRTTLAPLAPLVVLVASLGLTACGSSDTGGTDSAGANTGAAASTASAADSSAAPAAAEGSGKFDTDPCGLLTLDEATPVVGGTAVLGKRTDLDDVTECSWKHREGISSSTVHVGYYYWKDQTPDDLKKLASEQSPEATAFPGLGDAAYYLPDAQTVDFLSGGRMYYVIAGVEGNKEKAAKQVGELVLSHL